MSGVKAESDGLSILGAQAAVRAQNQEFGIKQPRRVPAHAGALGQAEEISRRLREQHLGGQRQGARRARGMGGHARQVRVVCLQNGSK